MTRQPLPIMPERVKMVDAVAITGKAARALRTAAAAGKIPGATKLIGEWTFDLVALRAWTKSPQREQASPCASAKPPRTASGSAMSSGGARRSTARKGDGRYERTIRTLLQSGSKQTANAR